MRDASFHVADIIGKSFWLADHFGVTIFFLKIYIFECLYATASNV
jgi:hypothetical protein